jgi:glycerol kinase
MFLAIDQGTTGTTCLVLDVDGRPVARAYEELAPSFPRPGWVEHDAAALWEVTRRVAVEALRTAGVPPGGLTAVGIANQRETVCAWDPHTAEPLHAAIVWQDRRTAERCRELERRGVGSLVRRRTGLVLDPYFSATKIEWLLDHVDGLRERAGMGHAVFGTVDAWLLFKLTGELATEPTNASRTLLYDIHAQRWDEELLATFGDIPLRSLPAVRSSVGVLGATRAGALPGFEGVPVTAMAGDQQAALVGHGCLAPGLGKSTYGTGCFVLVHTGQTPAPAPDGLVSTVALATGRQTTFAVEGSILVAGAAVQWLRDGLGLIASTDESEVLAGSLDHNDGVYFVPALTGLGSPHWDPFARGTIVGLTRGTGRAHLARAALEGIAYQVVDAIDAMHAAGADPLRELKVDGGATDNAWLMQFQADLLGVPVIVPALSEMTALGVALLAGVEPAAWSLEALPPNGSVRARYEPAMRADDRLELLDGWRRAVQRARGFADDGAPHRGSAAAAGGRA